MQVQFCKAFSVLLSFFTICHSSNYWCRTKWVLVLSLGLGNNGNCFFGFWEIYILCSHCPFYALNDGLIVCIANFGCPQFWRYQPGPISKSKKIQLVIGFIIMSGYPFIFMILGHQYLLFFISLFGLLFFFGGLFKFKCTKCVNFSCVFNRVPKNIVDSYLKKNPIMAKAWEDAGWQIDHTENS